MRERWAAAFAATAQAYWTPERTRALTGGKNLAVLPGQAPVLLRALGLLHRDASMPPAQVRKYRQINHMVAVLGPALRELRQRFPEVCILDAACGRSYLTVLLAWCFRHSFGHPARILGVDRNGDLVEECRRRTQLAGLDGVLRYQVAELGDLADGRLEALWRGAFGADPQPVRVHALVSLHACDTATDDAIALGLSHGAQLIAVAPCCQAELASRWAELADDGRAGAFHPFWSTPHLRRQSAATLTDAFRMLMLRGAGYDATAVEFVASTHTSKNTLIRAMRRGEVDPEPLRQYLALKRATGGAGIALEAQAPSWLRSALEALEGEPG